MIKLGNESSVLIVLCKHINRAISSFLILKFYGVGFLSHKLGSQCNIYTNTDNFAPSTASKKAQ